ncbi:MAG: electron transfer flavoprotein subunit beta/FixA family protein [Armatimonadota bacterium]|nr:MAG: electron transfer flavoprotein subunit beta/FixA family protein [Armatimonadota bacterium]
MRIAICVKPVPDLEKAYVSKSQSELVEQGKRVPNPADENAVELALALRQDGDELVAFTVGGDDALDPLRRILAMGVDRAHLIDDEQAQGGDALADAKTVAAAIRHAGDFDLILCGGSSIIHNAGQIGPRVAEALGVPHVTRVTGAKASDGKLNIERAGSLGAAELQLPALLAVEPGCNSPRLPNAMAVMKAAKKPIERPTASDLGLAAEDIGATGAGVRLRVLELPQT